MHSLRDLPAIDRLIRDPGLQSLIERHGLEIVKQALRSLQSSWRGAGQAPEWAADVAGYERVLTERLHGQGYRPVFNLTGTIIHTNLGRALIDSQLYRSIEELVTRPINLEYDLAAGRRGDRERSVEEKLKALTGAEAATVVNNGAAAVLLVLNTLALGREVAVSRGELIEIGGSFRLPDIMSRSGCRLREVGTTNRTHLKDYEGAIAAETGLLLKVHPSNYHISGFTSEVDVRSLAEVGRTHSIPVCVDLGSGTLVDLVRFGLPHEPMPQEVLKQGADLVTFSGDKLLGATQAGIILGRADLIAGLKRNPLKRALRPDKLTLAFLEKTLSLYETPDTLNETLPLVRTLTAPLSELQARGDRVRSILLDVLPDFSIDVVDSDCQLGSGSLPEQRISSRAIRIAHPQSADLEGLRDRLRRLDVPVIGRLQQDHLWLDMRGAERLDELCDNLRSLALTA
ncbi:MAG: L-seryl-tRNA(Sec) selenium transferase [Pseudomonadales bacterium]|nr:L-seryl-tRNA(Sec) selenium transferase [Pseudomonadales bacterium]